MQYTVLPWTKLESYAQTSSSCCSGTCVFSLHTLTVNDVSSSKTRLTSKCVSDFGINEWLSLVPGTRP